jgi:4-deoxy-L-threo-5-hexosulose-uronate ketol-isomerase
MKFVSSVHPDDVELLSTDDLRERFLVSDLFEAGEVKLIYWEVDRTVVGGVVPTAGPLALDAPAGLRSASFCERRELGVINLGGDGAIEVDGTSHAMAHLDGLYVGRGVKKIVFTSADAEKPARFYLLSYTAHTAYPTTHIPCAGVKADKLGAPETANLRLLRKYIAPGLVQSCQLTMGLTVMESGSVWNTMPPHTHLRRSEVYCYTKVAPGNVVFHFMGEPHATRHLVMEEGQVVLSPPWSIHMGCGNGAYGFVWGMGGENQEFSDMDFIPARELR